VLGSISSSTFDDPIYELYYHYGGATQSLCATTCVLLYFSLLTSKSKNVVWLLLGYQSYSHIIDLMYTVSTTQNTFEIMIMFAWTVIIMSRHEHKQEIYDDGNILLAFYRGEKGSFIMNFFQLFGLGVKSMSIMAGDKCLLLKSNKDGFQFTDSKTILKNKANYLIVETDKPYTQKFVEKMASAANKPAKKYGLRIRCIDWVYYFGGF